MTFEVARDYEQAKMHYLSARRFAWALIDMYSETADKPMGGAEIDQDDYNLRDLRMVMKQVYLLYQPLFAEAWVGEKSGSATDIADGIVEAGLLRLRRTLPALRLHELTRTSDLDSQFEHGKSRQPRWLGAVGNAQFLLVGAEMHNKAGDLYFFKGRQIPSATSASEDKTSALGRYVEALRRAESPEPEQGFGPEQPSAAGYLLRAYYHYVVALHEIRRYTAFRKGIAAIRLNPLNEGGDPKKGFSPLQPDNDPHALTVTQVNSLNDLADTTLARVSLLSVWLGPWDGGERDVEPDIIALSHADSSEEKQPRVWTTDKVIAIFLEELESWFAKFDDETCQEPRDEKGALCSQPCSLGRAGVAKDESALGYLVKSQIGGFLGTWQGDPDESAKRFPFALKTTHKPLVWKTTHPTIVNLGTLMMSSDRMFVGIMLQMAAAKKSAEAGNVEAGAREYLTAMEMAGRHLKWFRILLWLEEKARATDEMSSEKENAIKGVLENAGVLPKETAPENAGVSLEATIHEQRVRRLTLYASLSALTRHALREYDRLAKKGWRRPSRKDKYQIGDAIAPEAATTTSAIALVCAKFATDAYVEQENLEQKLREPLEDDERVQLMSLKVEAERCAKSLKNDTQKMVGTVEEWLGDSAKNAERFDTRAGEIIPDDEKQQWTARGQILYILSRHRYPALNQMFGLKYLVDDSVLEFGDRYKDEGQQWLAELSYVAARFDAPMHFPLGRLGESLALADLAGWNLPARKGMEDTPIANIAVEVLRESREAYTLGRAYYRNIERLHYVYDDFNDRRIHAKHALHMAGSEVTSLLEAIIAKYNEPNEGEKR